MSMRIESAASRGTESIVTDTEHAGIEGMHVEGAFLGGKVEGVRMNGPVRCFRKGGDIAREAPC